MDIAPYWENLLNMDIVFLVYRRIEQVFFFFFFINIHNHPNVFFPGEPLQIVKVESLLAKTIHSF